MVNALYISGLSMPGQGIRTSRFDERGIAYPRREMSGAPRKEGARILGARVLASAVAVPILLVLALTGGAARIAGVVAATAPDTAATAARVAGHAARAVPARKLAIRPPRVALASVGSQQVFAVPAAAGLALVLILMAGAAPVRSRLRRAPRGLPATRAPPARLA
jgi:hypothetical protein